MQKKENGALWFYYSLFFEDCVQNLSAHMKN